MARKRTAALGLLALVGVILVVAGCGYEGTVSPLPQKVTGSLPKPAPTAKGNPVAGKPVFTSAGCGACHTYTPAASTGKVGPDLDNLAAYAAKAGQPIDVFTLAAIVSPPAKYVPPGYPTNVMPTTYGTTLNDQQLADLVAFLTKP